jgi:hypothetical protein
MFSATRRNDQPVGGPNGICYRRPNFTHGSFGKRILAGTTRRNTSQHALVACLSYSGFARFGTSAFVIFL